MTHAKSALARSDWTGELPRATLSSMSTAARLKEHEESRPSGPVPQFALDIERNMSPEDKAELRRMSAGESDEGDMDAKEAIRQLRQEAAQVFAARES